MCGWAPNRFLFSWSGVAGTGQEGVLIKIFQTAEEKVALTEVSMQSTAITEEKSVGSSLAAGNKSIHMAWQ